jgi:pimeloyl-ACP methyl ester carboxylesterase
MRQGTTERSGIAGPTVAVATVNGIGMAYRWWPGPGAGRATHPAAVVLHGVLQSGEGMTNLAAHLSRRGPVLVPDLRGRGGSDQPDDGYDPATMAADVAGLIEHLGLDRPVVIGRHHGGVVAYTLAATRPDLVRGLVIGDAAPELSAARAERSIGAIRALPDRFASFDEAVAFYEGALGLSPARARHDIPSDLVAEPDGGYRWRHNLAVVARIEAAAAPRADWPLLARIACPVLLLRGQRGHVPPDMAERIRQAIPGCQVQTVLGARHDVFLGPGAEQSFGAINVFLMRLADGREPAQLGLPALGIEPPPPGEGGVIERIIAAINGRDDAVVEALFAPDGRFTLHGSDGSVSHGGADVARGAFWRLLDAFPGATVSWQQRVETPGRAATILVATVAGAAEPALLLPVFVDLAGDRIAAMTVFAARRL